jgi:hypothetical protein
MANDTIGLALSAIAAEDLSAKKYYAVKLDSAHKAAAITSTIDIMAGILLNAPAAGEAARYAPLGSGGVCSWISSGTIATGVIVAPAVDGKAQAAAATQYPSGLVVRGGAANELLEVLLTPMTVKA